MQLSGSDLHAPLLLMDTGSAAVLGSLEDPVVRQQRDCILCDIGNFHTLAFHLVDGQIVGIFEYHTGEISKTRLEELLVRLADGTLTNEDVFNDSGHGALLLRRPTAGAFPFLSVVGPRRALLRGSTLRPYEAVPQGDMMLTGTYGLLHACAEQYPDMAPFIETSLLPC